MLANTDVDSNSEKKMFFFFIQDKSQRPSNAVFAVFLGEKNPTNDIDFNLTGRKRCFLEDWKLNASSIPLNKNTF